MIELTVVQNVDWVSYEHEHENGWGFSTTYIKYFDLGFISFGSIFFHSYIHLFLVCLIGGIHKLWINLNILEEGFTFNL